MDYASVGSVQIGGPFKIAAAGRANESPSRRAIFVCQPRGNEPETVCATTILSRLARLAYRRPVTRTDIQTLLEFFKTGREVEGKAGGSFDSGIQFALERLLVDPDFLLRVDRDPNQVRLTTPAKAPAVKKADPTAGGAYRLSDIEVASRLSFFLWSSIPDERLLDLAEREQLSSPRTLEQEARRMLGDRKAIDALVDDFAAQWLNLRRPVKWSCIPTSIRISTRACSRRSSRKRRCSLPAPCAKTAACSISCAQLHLCERTAGEALRDSRHLWQPVPPGTLPNPISAVDCPRTAHAGHHVLSRQNVARPAGKWLLDNIFGLPVPPPPPGVDTTLPDAAGRRAAHYSGAAGGAPTPARLQQLSFGHRSAGLRAREFRRDRWVEDHGRSRTAGGRSGDTAEWREDRGAFRPAGVSARRADRFPTPSPKNFWWRTLGRRLEITISPPCKIVRDAAASDYRWSSLILGIVKSPPFLMRKTAAEEISSVKSGVSSLK